jgi:hypothetical protein
MKLKLLKSTIFTVLMLLFVSGGNINAQCNFIGNVDSNSLGCPLPLLNGCSIITIGDGIIATTLLMKGNLDLSCFGAITFVLKNNATIDFDASNNPNLKLAVGSSIIIENGGKIKSVSNCSASDLITIGVVKVASCNQGSAEYSFTQLVTMGGYNTVKTSVSSVCGVDGSSIEVSVIPAPSSPTIYKLYSLSNGVYTLIALSTVLSENKPFSAIVKTPANSSFTSFYIEATSGSATTQKKEIVVKGAASATWNGSVIGWRDDIAPSVDRKIIFKDAYTASDNLVGCSCEVQSGAVTFPSGKTLTLTNELKVTGGSLTFENNASLVQINDLAVNSGPITYQRAVTGIKYKDYVYWSSPVSNQSLSGFSSTATYFWNTGITTSNWNVPSTVNMTAGLGYIIRRDAAEDFTASFNGTPNNGNVSVNILKATGFNLIGNPYPSAIDVTAFLTDDNNKKFVGGTIYLWTHNTAIKLASDALSLVYTSNDYASYNISGGVATGNKSSNGTEVIANKPSGKIAAGQGFFVSSVGSGAAVFKNSMRYFGTDNRAYDNSQFFKTKSPSKTTTAVEKSRVWLNLTNAGGAFKQTLIAYISGATNDFDSAYDGPSYNGNQFINFYSINLNRNLVIQGRALPFTEKDTVALGYKTTIAGEFKIAIDEVDGLLVNKKIYLEDKLLSITQDLSVAPYIFTTEIGSFNERFVLRYTNKTLATVDMQVVENEVLISNKNKEIKITAPSNEIEQVFVYDVSGRQIYMKSKVGKEELMINTILSSDQVLIVKVVLQNGQIISRKMIY